MSATVASNYVLVITGAARGLGFETVRQLLEDPKNNAASAIPNDATIVAPVRDLSKATELKKLQTKYGAARLDIVEPFEATNDKHIKTLVEHVTKKYGRLDLLLNNAGVTEANAFSAFPSSIKWDEAEHVFAVNTFGPVKLTQAFLPLLKSTLATKRAAIAKSGATEKKDSPLVQVTFISTLMGSLTEFKSFPAAPSYRASKAALNMYVKAFALEQTEIAFQLIHPGWVKTDMGTSNAPLEPVDSIKGVLKVIAGASLSKSATALENYDGTQTAW